MRKKTPAPLPIPQRTDVPVMDADPQLLHHPKLKQHVLKLVEKAGDTFN